MKILLTVVILALLSCEKQEPVITPLLSLPVAGRWEYKDTATYNRIWDFLSADTVAVEFWRKDTLRGYKKQHYLINQTDNGLILFLTYPKELPMPLGYIIKNYMAFSRDQTAFAVSYYDSFPEKYTMLFVRTQ